MAYTQALFDEISILRLFSLESMQEGIKIHSSAGPEKVAAAQRLFDKGMITLHDGGYLTHRGLEAAQHAHTLLNLLLAAD
jgi:uncharacterized protein (TIGR02647 family)